MRQFLLAGAVLWTVGAHGAEPLKSEKKDRVVQTKSGDFRIVTDRDETVADFFRRNRILLGDLPPDGAGERGDLKAILAAEKVIDGVSMNHASVNYEPKPKSRFVTLISVAPPTPAVARLLAEFKKGENVRFVLILCRDEGEKSYRPVGYTTHSPVGFFTDERSGTVEGIAAKTLRFAAPEKK